MVPIFIFLGGHRSLVMSVRAFTLLSRSERPLSQYIRKLDISNSSTSIFALCAPPSGLQTIFDDITNLRSNNLGCISAQIDPSFPFCLSFMNIPRSVDHRIWRSTIPGTEKAQVGRWYSKEQISRDSQEVDVESLSFWSEARRSKVPKMKLPSPLQDLSDRRTSLSSILYFTDDASEGLANALTQHFLGASKLGLTASATPFITGRPFTLFESGTFHSSGAVGVAFTGKPKANCTVTINDLKAFGVPMTVTSSAFNMIYTLDGSPAVDILARCVPELGQDVHDVTLKTVYLGIFDAQGQVCRTFSISAGSPSRGAILLDGEWTPEEGMTVQFLTPSKSTESHLSTLLSDAAVPEAHLLCLSQDESIPPKDLRPDDGSEDCVVIKQKFIAASEGGFSLDDGRSRAGLQGNWRCTTPRVMGSIFLPH